MIAEIQENYLWLPVYGRASEKMWPPDVLSSNCSQWHLLLLPQMFQNLIHTMCITHVFLGDPNLEPKFPTICLPCFFFGLFVTSRWLGIKASAVVQKSSRVLHLCLEAQGVTSGSSQNLQSISSSVLHYCNQLVRMEQGLTKLMVKVGAWNLKIQPN